MAGIRITFNTSEVDELARDLLAAPPKTVKRVATAGGKRARNLSTRWRSGARRSSGAHGPHYHKAITVERVGPLTWDIGPQSGMPQGGMSFEYGSRNQPPHLDGNNAADIEFPKFSRDIEQALYGGGLL